MSWACSTNLYLRVSISPFCGHVRCSTSIPCFSCPRHKFNDFSRELLLLRSEKGLESRRQTPGVAAAPGASWLPRQHVSHARSRDQVPSACRSLCKHTLVLPAPLAVRPGFRPLGLLASPPSGSGARGSGISSLQRPPARPGLCVLPVASRPVHQSGTVRRLFLPPLPGSQLGRFAGSVCSPFGGPRDIPVDLN